MERVILTGETGSGKTYEAIKNFNKNKKFVYLAPCRQLVYESFIEYSSDVDSIKTGEVCMFGTRAGNMYSVYESFRVEEIYAYDSVIIDEAHFIAEEDRGGHLVDIVNAARNKNKNIYLVTATDTLDRRFFRDFENHHLKSKHRVPEKIEVSEKTFLDNIKKDMKTIIFCRSIADTKNMAESFRFSGFNAEAINSTVLPADRLKIQYGFKRGDIQIVCSTNVLAQGLNFPAENVYISSDMWNTDELLIQKLGRLGRPFISKTDKVFYCIEEDVPKKLKKKKPAKKRVDQYDFYIPYLEDGFYGDSDTYIKVRNYFIVDSSFSPHQFCRMSSLYDYEDNCYNSVKYAKGFVYFLKKYIAPISAEVNTITDVIIYWLQKNEEAVREVIEDLRAY